MLLIAFLHLWVEFWEGIDKYWIVLVRKLFYFHHCYKPIKILSKFQNQVPLRKFKSPIQYFLTTVLVFKPHMFSRESLVGFDS